jgi:hypothetical protein
VNGAGVADEFGRVVAHPFLSRDGEVALGRLSPFLSGRGVVALIEQSESQPT